MSWRDLDASEKDAVCLDPALDRIDSVWIDVRELDPNRAPRDVQDDTLSFDVDIVVRYVKCEVHLLSHTHVDAVVAQADSARAEIDRIATVHLVVDGELDGDIGRSARTVATFGIHDVLVGCGPRNLRRDIDTSDPDGHTRGERVTRCVDSRCDRARSAGVYSQGTLVSPDSSESRAMHGPTKYPRTPHLPWSRGRSPDDVVLDAEHLPLAGHNVVVTEKLDGENTSMYRDHIHARSIDSRMHPSRSWVRGLHGRIAHLIPDGWRLCGENVYAVHSLRYRKLASYFYLFSIWDETGHALSWDDTLEWAALLDLPTPIELYRGPWSVDAIGALEIDTDVCEGLVVRRVDRFHHDAFARCVAKWVRADHVQTDEHWMHKPVEPNGLADSRDRHRTLDDLIACRPGTGQYRPGSR